MSLSPLPKKIILHTQLPNHYWYGDVVGHTDAAMEAYGQQCRIAAFEEAAESLFTLDIESYGILPIRASIVISDCNLTIRKLK